MANFEVLGDRYDLSKEELSRAPQSLLTQAAELQEDKTAAVAVDKWPDPHKYNVPRRDPPCSLSQVDCAGCLELLPVDEARAQVGPAYSSSRGRPDLLQRWRRAGHWVLSFSRKS